MPDSDRGIVLLIGQNLFFLGRVETLAEPLGYEVRRATTEEAFWENFGTHRLGLILIDLEGQESVWDRILGEINRQGRKRFKVVAFGPHENTALLERARELRCDLVLNKGEFNRGLPKILESLKIKDV